MVTSELSKETRWLYILYIAKRFSLCCACVGVMQFPTANASMSVCPFSPPRSIFYYTDWCYTTAAVIDGQWYPTTIRKPNKTKTSNNFIDEFFIMFNQLQINLEVCCIYSNHAFELIQTSVFLYKFSFIGHVVGIVFQSRRRRRFEFKNICYTLYSGDCTIIVFVWIGF